MLKWRSLCCAGMLLVGCAVPPAPPPPGADVTGPVAMEVGANRALLWLRAPAATDAALTLEQHGTTVTEQIGLSASADFSGHFRLTELRPDSRYSYTVTIDYADHTEQIDGTLTTAPAADQRRPVRLLWSGDVAGQNVCRDKTSGFTIMPQLLAQRADLMIGLGDMIYADGLCKPLGRYGNQQIAAAFPIASSRPEFHHHWRYARNDPAFASLLRQLNYYAVWDDHEVTNDFGPNIEASLFDSGLRAFLDYNPQWSEPPTLYRSVRYGQQLQLLFLDTRQYRSANQAPDAAEKTLLGATQKQWLIEQLVESDATWKLIVSSVPIAVPTGWPPQGPRDGWASQGGATGFERELREIIDAASRAAVENIIWLSTDVHFATGFEYRRPDGNLLFHEFIVGPLSAGLFPNRSIDPTLNPRRLFFYGPESPEAVADYTSATGWFNFGMIDIDSRGRLSLSVINGHGETVHQMQLQPQQAFKVSVKGRGQL